MHGRGVCGVRGIKNYELRIMNEFREVIRNREEVRSEAGIC